jgi:DNA-binding FrmR family transcriptional regulator
MSNVIVKEELLNRLKTIKGHIAGIEKMLEEGKSCEDILLQIAAVRSSIEKTGLLILEKHAVDCLFSEVKETSSRERLEEIVSTIIKFLK